MPRVVVGADKAVGILPDTCHLVCSLDGSLTPRTEKLKNNTRSKTRTLDLYKGGGVLDCKCTQYLNYQDEEEEEVKAKLFNFSAQLAGASKASVRRRQWPGRSPGRGGATREL